MAAVPKSDFLLFVSGEPDQGLSARSVPTSFSLRLAGGVLPTYLFMNSPPNLTAQAEYGQPDLAEGRPWRLPADQIMCVNMVDEIAEHQLRGVALIDVDRPSGREALVRKWIGPNDVLPVLVRPDGARLQGFEEFNARKVRKFIAGP
jgi:hypothetical protein